MFATLITLFTSIIITQQPVRDTIYTKISDSTEYKELAFYKNYNSIQIDTLFNSVRVLSSADINAITTENIYDVYEKINISSL